MHETAADQARLVVWAREEVLTAVNSGARLVHPCPSVPPFFCGCLLSHVVPPLLAFLASRFSSAFFPLRRTSVSSRTSHRCTTEGKTKAGGDGPASEGAARGPKTTQRLK